MKSPLLLLLSCLAPLSSARGAVITFDGLNALIPDGKGSGLVDTRVLGPDLVPGLISQLSVSLSISGVGSSGAFNGDLFVTLQHDSGFAVLLNRPGKSGLNLYGYGDNGLNVTFDDSGGSPDVHTYQLTLGGAPAGPLTGTWAPDGRSTDPNVVTEAAARAALLNSFLGLTASGTWTLFLADLEMGGEARLDAWSLDITTVPIPEPSGWWLIGGFGLAFPLLVRRRA